MDRTALQVSLSGVDARALHWVGMPTTLAPGPTGANEGSDVLRDLVERSRPDQLEDRVAASFLQRSDFEKHGLIMGTLRASLFWQTLPGFLSASGWTELGRYSWDRYGSEILPPKLETLDLGQGVWLAVPRKMSVYVERGTERAVLSTLGEDEGPSKSYQLTVNATNTPHSILEGWQDHVRQDNLLRGRSLLPTGKLVHTADPPSWDDLFLPDEIKEEIKFQVARLTRTDRSVLERFGLKRRGGFILSGPPGTGKTMIGRILSATCQCTMLWVTPAYFKECHEVREVIDLARVLAPTILFLEDIDLLAEDRSMRGGSAALGELMNQLDGCHGDHEICTVATTNRAEVLETAIRNRPGRFDRVIEIPSPSARQCREYFEMRLSQCEIDPADLGRLCESAAGRTGAELEELANTALLLAIEREGGDGERLRVSGEAVDRALASCSATNMSSQLGY